MKPKGVLVISLAINLGLIAALAHYSNPGPASAEMDDAPVTVRQMKTQVVNRAVTQVVTTQAKPKFSWRSVESPDYKEYIAHLRSIECPEQTIRDIIIADVDKLFAPRYAALRAPQQQDYAKYWKRNMGFRRTNPDVQKQFKALDAEKDALIQELLGVDEKTARGNSNWWEDQQNELLSFLSPEKQQQLRKLREKFDQERQDIYARASGYFDQDDQADIRKVHKKELAEMAGFMTPDEIFEYEVRTSDTARNLQRQVASMNVTEDEFRTLFKATSALDDYKNPDPDQRRDKDYMTKWRETEKASQDEIKALLGDARYKEYQRGSDYAYQSLMDMSSVLGFDKTAANTVYDMKDTAETAAREVRNDKSLSSEDRTAKLKAIREETELAIKNTIGEKGYKAYRRQGGYWIGNIYNQK